MKCPRESYQYQNRRGASAILLLVLTSILFVAVCFSVDIARIQLAQLELQSASDLISRAGAEAMSRGVADPNDHVATDAAVRAEIDMIAQLNIVGGDPLQLNLTDDITFGEAAEDPGGNFVFTASPNGAVDATTDAIQVASQIPSFPVIFGAFVDQTEVGLGKLSSAMISERDIVIVVDRSGSMRDNRDAGTIPESEYVINLRNFHDTLNNGDNFVVNGSDLELTRSQALKLAVLNFREAIDNSRGHEQLGLVAYAEAGDNSNSAMTADAPFDVRVAIPVNLEAEAAITTQFASRLETMADGYKNFDANYISIKNGGKTHIVDGIDKGVQILFGAERRPYAVPVMIVMTDGQHNMAGTPDAAATAAKTAHPELQIYTITFGNGADQAIMQLVAQIGDGEHYHAANVNQLTTVFVDLANRAGVTLVE